MVLQVVVFTLVRLPWQTKPHVPETAPTNAELVSVLTAALSLEEATWALITLTIAGLIAALLRCLLAPPSARKAAAHHSSATAKAHGAAAPPSLLAPLAPVYVSGDEPVRQQALKCFLGEWEQRKAFDLTQRAALAAFRLGLEKEGLLEPW